jgi:hypothetical protein
MTAEHPEPLKRLSSSLEQLIAESGRTPDGRIEEFTRLAGAVQRQRSRIGVSNTTRITRSTALWTLMQLDEGIKAALQSGGVDQAALGSVLSISAVPPPIDVDVAELHEDFARAMREYLATLPSQRAVVLLADLAVAIVRDGQDDSRGLLPRRLKDLRVGYDIVVPALDQLIPAPSSDPVQAISPPPLSETMRSVAEELSASSRTSEGAPGVTAFEIAQAIGRRHPEYASGLLGAAMSEAPSSAVRHAWDSWETSVSRLYDRGVVADSRHEVLDGRLFLVGLSLIDSSLKAALDRHGAWGPLVVEVDEAVAPAGSPLRPVLQAVQFAYGYQSDRASGQDQLGVQGEVNAVCEVILDADVKPPLAIGLFGEWGAGKSFFMEKMRERVAERTRPSLEIGSDGDGKHLNVVQIRFNAWHYSDTSLWASLAIEIFERLADPEPVSLTDRDKWLRDRGDAGRIERLRLLRQLETYRDAKAALDAERRRLEAERRAVTRRREEATRQRREAIANMSLTDVAGKLATDQRVQEAIGQVFDELTLTPAVGELLGLGAELRTTAGYLPWVWRLVRHKTWVIALMAAFLVLTLVTAALALHGGWAWLGSLATAGCSVGAAVIAVVKLIRPAARRVNRALAKVESAIKTAATVEAELRSLRSREERALELRLAEIDTEITEATRAISALDEKIATTEATAEALTVGRKLYDFLADRAAGYQKHQGVVGMLHRDFRFLDAQLRAYQASPDTARQLPRIDRVILYIDDLDRCPPAKVLEVLEAVHLLLALELFVVVVGVDPRWLQRSLRYQYRNLVTSGDPRTDPYLRAMPIEYLEKIFQIPLTLPVMEPRAYARLIASLAPSIAAPEPPELKATATTHRTPTKESPGGDRAPTRAPLEVQPGSSASGDVGQPVDLTRTELEFAQQLGALVDSPRAAKRLMNTYRLIRATQHVGSRSRFLGDAEQAGEYQAVLTLLAVAAGYPALADRLLVALQEDATSNDIHRWPDFVGALAPQSTDRPPGRLMPADLTGTPTNDATQNELTNWTNLHKGLAASLNGNGLTDLEPYQRWARIVARFSFTL